MSVRTTRLKRVVSFQAGRTPSVSNPLLWAEPGFGVPWVSISDMSDGSQVTETAREVSEEGLRIEGLQVARAGTLLFAMYASVGAVATLGIPAVWNQALLGLQAREDKADIRFVRYWLEHLRPSLAGMVRSNTQDNLNAEQVGNLPYPTISMLKQQAIADFLDRETARIDALITKKQRLSELSQQRWRGELLEKLGVSRPYQDGTLDITVLPPGWQVGTLKRLLSDSFGGDWGSEPGEDNTDLQCVRSADFDFIGLRALEGAIRSFGKQTTSSRLVYPGDLVIEKSGGGEGVPVGRVVAWRGNGPAVPTNFAGGMRAAESADRDYTLLAFRAAYELGLPWRSIKQTTGLQNIDLSHYLNHVWPLPPLVEQQVIATELMHSLERVLTVGDRLSRQITLLRERRAALITAAVTGELEVA